MSITTIEWTKRPGTVGETWNPTTGCNKVDRGCKLCYAEVMHKRLQAMGQQKYAAPFLGGAVAHPETLGIPLTWRQPRTVFVNSMSDLFHPAVSFEFIADVFEVMTKTRQHTYLILTKRPERALEFWQWRNENRAAYLIKRGTVGTPAWECPPNVWMGTSVHDQASAEMRVPLLLELATTVHFLSYEPATGPLDLTRLVLKHMEAPHPDVSFSALRGWRGGFRRPEPTRLEWVICGGESGPKATPMHPDWARKVRDDCAASEVPFFFKQVGTWEQSQELQGKGIMTKARYLYDAEGNTTRFIRAKKKSGNLLDGRVHQAFPTP